MGIFTIFTAGLSGSKEQSPGRGEVLRLAAGYEPAIIEEYRETHEAVQETLRGNSRHPNTHPHLVAQANLDKLGQPALQGAFTAEQQQRQTAVEKLERTLDMMGLSGKQPDSVSNFTVPDDISQEKVSASEIEAAQYLAISPVHFIQNTAHHGRRNRKAHAGR